MRLRKVFGVLLVAIVAAIGLTAALASANDVALSGNEEPQTTNIPYTAWVGTEIRLAKCFDLTRESDDPVLTLLSADERSRLDGGQRISLASAIYRGKYSIEAWSGTNTSIVNSPFFVNGSNGDRTSQDVVPFVEHYRGAPVWTADDKGDKADRIWPGDEGYRLCYAVHLTSYSPGLAVVKLALREDILGLFPGQDPFLKHQFLAIFMTATEATLTEEPGGGDPTGNGAYHPQGTPGSRDWNPGYVKAVVKGTFPHGNIGPVFPSVTGTGAGGAVVLPTDWKLLADAWAVDDDPYAGGQYGSAPLRWDIHDDTTTAEDHTSNYCVTSPVLYDAVDNCLGNTGGGGLWSGNDPDLGPFSRDNTNHDALPVEAAYPAIGPFDPLRPNSSFLPDGKVDAGDANMPALRVDLDTTGTIGQLIKADKSNVYSRDGKGATTGATAHNLYAPFYKAYVPAANRSGTSGVAGTFGNNFPSFVNDGEYGVYDYWDTLLQEPYSNPNNECRNPLGKVYVGSRGISGVTLYTDEHGEAWAMYDPNLSPDVGGFAITPTVADVTNKKCDLSPGVAGIETITARGFYPEQPATGIPFDKTLTKTVYHEASKTLTCAPKVGFDGIICTETITDLAGNPLVNAPVRFSVESEVGGTAYVLRGEGQAGQKVGDDLNLWSDSNGQAKAFISSSFNRCLDIRVENLGTQWLPLRDSGAGNDSSVGVSRTAKYTGQTGVACGGFVPPVVPPVVTEPGGSTGGSGSGSSNSGGSSSGGSSSAAGSSVTVSLGGPVIQAQPVLQAGTNSTVSAIVASNSARLFSVKVLQTKLGRYLVVNVKGSAKTAKVRVQILGKNGKVMKTIIRTVPTNKAFKIADYKLAKTASSVRASVLAT